MATVGFVMRGEQNATSKVHFRLQEHWQDYSDHTFYFRQLKRITMLDSQLTTCIFE